MISNIFVDYLDGIEGGLGLTKTKDLFAEISRGDKYVLVGGTHVGGESTIPDIYHASINIQTAGWGVSAGESLATTVCKKLMEMEGRTFTFQGTVMEIYRVAGIVVRNWPVLIDPETATFSANIEVSYQMSTEV